jgi:hypothetical protein
LPSQFLEPRKAVEDTGNVEDRVLSLGVHSAILSGVRAFAGESLPLASGR